MPRAAAPQGAIPPSVTHPPQAQLPRGEKTDATVDPGFKESFGIPIKMQIKLQMNPREDPRLPHPPLALEIQEHPKASQLGAQSFDLISECPSGRQGKSHCTGQQKTVVPFGDN